MIACIVLISFLSSMILSYKLGCINGFKQGFNECDALNERTIDELSSALENARSFHDNRMS